MYFDIFNGDADGLCALHQLRLAEPLHAQLITGTKRDIALLERVEAVSGDHLTVLDISLRVNAHALTKLLSQGVAIRWFDHHNPGMIAAHAGFEAHIDTAADVCTSLIVDRHLVGRYRPWAVVAAFGDNLHASARRAAEPLGLDESRLDMLRQLGTCLNYNGYGDSLDDLHFHPAELYLRLRAYSDPFAYVAESSDFASLKSGYRADLAAAEAVAAEEVQSWGAVYMLPDAPWARRVSGVFANQLAQHNPERAHAILTPTRHGLYTISVRAPVSRPTGADSLCMRFEHGGGRQAAAGINDLPAARLDDFIKAFRASFCV
jgi:hypothetical protein